MANREPPKRQTYSFPEGALQYCRTCQGLRPHRVAADRSGVKCTACSRIILTAEVVANYSADENENPAPIMLPWRLLPPGERNRRLELIEEDVPSV